MPSLELWLLPDSPPRSAGTKSLPFSTFQTEFGWFKAEGTPITNVDDYGRQNSYPLMRVEATDRSDGSVLAAIDAERWLDSQE